MGCDAQLTGMNTGRGERMRGNCQSWNVREGQTVRGFQQKNIREDVWGELYGVMSGLWSLKVMSGSPCRITSLYVWWLWLVTLWLTHTHTDRQLSIGYTISSARLAKNGGWEGREWGRRKDTVWVLCTPCRGINHSGLGCVKHWRADQCIGSLLF